MAMFELKREGEVFILNMQNGENMFTIPFLEALNQALDSVEQSSGPAALVTVGNDPKFYSNGIDLAWLRGEGKSQWTTFVDQLVKFLGRVLAFPIPTVAAVNGHAIAAGAMYALAHDARVMRADRGFIYLPEVDVNIPLEPGMTALIRSKVSPTVFRDLLLTGARIGGGDAKEREIVDEVAPADQVLPQAISRAAALAKKGRQIYGTLKRGMYAEALALLEAGKK